jgi:hypothetical protein
MRELKYGYFGEDEAQRIFLGNYLIQLIDYLGKSKDIFFNYDVEFSYVFKGVKNSTIIDQDFAEAVRVGFIKYGQDLFFVGRDLDTYLDKEFKRKLASMQNELDEKFKGKTFLMIPVQCIEHWLWYMKFKVDNPDSTKNIPLESKPNPEAKKAVYGSPKISNKKSIPIVEEYSKQIDFDYLESRSESFRVFHNSVKNFLMNLK